MARDATGRNRVTRTAAALALVLALALTLLASGCGPSTPDAAVQQFVKSIETKDWNGYLGSVLPDQVRSMSETDVKNRRQAFKENNERFSDVKLQVNYDKKNKDKAEVIITGGKVTRMNPTTRQNESQNLADFPQEARTLTAVKYKGRWYVDVPLITEAQPQQQQPQEGTQPAPEGTQPPPEGTQPPPEETSPQPEGTLPQGTQPTQ